MYATGAASQWPVTNDRFEMDATAATRYLSLLFSFPQEESDQASEPHQGVVRRPSFSSLVARVRPLSLLAIAIHSN